MKSETSRRWSSILAVVLLALVAGSGPAAAQPASQKDIVDTAVAAGSFKTLAAALTVHLGIAWLVAHQHRRLLEPEA